jgi:DNA replication protein DnaC
MKCPRLGHFQVPADMKEWYSIFKNPTLTDAIMDRVIHNAHRLEVEGVDSMRKIKNRVGLSDTLH